jgi:hypothetical protein
MMVIGRAYSDDSLSELSNCGLPVEERILPAQFHDLLHGTGERSGEHRLMVALLEDALHCWLEAAKRGIHTTVRREKEHREADAWIFGGYCAPLTFEQVCSWLDLDAEYVRCELLKVGESDSSTYPMRYRRSTVRSQRGLRTRVNLVRKRSAISVQQSAREGRF